MLHADQRDALEKAITLIESITFDGYGVLCSICGDAVTSNGPNPVAPVLCPVCVFWADRIHADHVSRIRDIPNVFSIRALGQHYTIDERAPEGPMMTVRFFDGVTAVTLRLKQQGPIPARMLSVLGDNATIEEGNPHDLPLGVHRL